MAKKGSKAQSALPFEDPVVTFADRSLTRVVGQELLENPITALCELIANAWDAGATRVEIQWPDEESTLFSIKDNGHGMTEEEFRRRYMKFDYDRRAEQGDPAIDIDGVTTPRRAYGRNGIGRFGAFAFGDEFVISTGSPGTWSRWRLTRSPTRLCDVKKLGQEPSADNVGSGTRVSVSIATTRKLSATDVKSEIALRFLADPNFTVLVNGESVAFEDLPEEAVEEFEIALQDDQIVTVQEIDLEKAGRTTKTRGIAHWVNGRLVGSVRYPSHIVNERKQQVVDGRTNAAKRLLFIVRADALKDAVLSDWSGFDRKNALWLEFKEKLYELVQGRVSRLDEEGIQAVIEGVKANNTHAVRRLDAMGQKRWTGFVEQLARDCPSMKERDIDAAAKALAKMEIAHSRFSLLEKLAAMTPTDVDGLNAILETWTLDGATRVLAELEWRIKVMARFERLTSDHSKLELQDIQPLMQGCFWMFGSEFDSVEFTSNQTLTSVISRFFNKEVEYDRRRPDFVVVPTGSVHLRAANLALPDRTLVVGGRVIVVELKRPGVLVGHEEVFQAASYASRIASENMSNSSRMIDAFVLGTSISPIYAKEPLRVNSNISIHSMTYDTLLGHAKRRTLELYDRVKSLASIESAAEQLELPTRPA